MESKYWVSSLDIENRVKEMKLAIYQAQMTHDPYEIVNAKRVLELYLRAIVMLCENQYDPSQPISKGSDRLIQQYHPDAKEKAASVSKRWGN